MLSNLTYAVVAMTEAGRPAMYGAAIVETFARLLEAKITVPVVLQDERLSSHEAESRLAQRESDWRKRKAKLDAVAAAIILQDYLDERPRPMDGLNE